MEDKGVHAIPRGIHWRQRGLHSRHAGIPPQDEAYEVYYRYASDSGFADIVGSSCTHEGFDIESRREHRIDEKKGNDRIQGLYGSLRCG